MLIVTPFKIKLIERSISKPFENHGSQCFREASPILCKDSFPGRNRVKNSEEITRVNDDLGNKKSKPSDFQK